MRYDQKCVLVLLKVPIILDIFRRNLNFRGRVSRNYRIYYFTKIYQIRAVKFTLV